MIEPRQRVPTMLRDRILMSRNDRILEIRSGAARTSWAGKVAETIRKALRTIGNFRYRCGRREIPDPGRD
jgi:hypothetical protein